MGEDTYYDAATLTTVAVWLKVYLLSNLMSAINLHKRVPINTKTNNQNPQLSPTTSKQPNKNLRWS